MTRRRVTSGVPARHNHAMVRVNPIRFGSVLLGSALILGGTAILCAQAPQPKPAAAVPPSSTLPTAQPTSADAARPVSAPVEMHIRVEFANGRLDVDASNGSLNQILREVSQKTGIKITGSVPEERVFGHYGPSPASVVLASLLDGTGSNMLLVDDATGKSELVLTARHGGASPPSPSSASQSRESEEQGQGNAPRYVPPTRPFQPPSFSGRGPVRANQDGSPMSGPPTAPPNQDPNQPGEGSQPQPPQ